MWSGHFLFSIYFKAISGYLPKYTPDLLCPISLKIYLIWKILLIFLPYMRTILSSNVWF